MIKENNITLQSAVAPRYTYTDADNIGLARDGVPSVLLELGYHDNPDDALWIQENIPRIAANLVLSLTEYFGLPYTAPTPQPGQVSTVSGGPVNLRSGPSLQSTVTARLPDGDGVTVYGRYQDWYVVSHGEHLGYVSAPFIRLS